MKRSLAEVVPTIKSKQRLNHLQKLWEEEVVLHMLEAKPIRHLFQILKT